MAIVTRSDDGTTLDEPAAVAAFLGHHGIWYRRFTDPARLRGGATDAEILAAFAGPIAELKEEGGYTTADVIDVGPDTSGLVAMLAKFSREHWHDEDEVRFIVEGRGVFHIHPAGGAVFRIEVRAGDMIRVPRGTLHWFDLCPESRIRAIRLFQNAAGWTPRYTDSGVEAGHEPLCFGPQYLPPSSAR
jgi:1,2-dihydroxy-3-keto-5-methylthiopentene dioxygenase